MTRDGQVATKNEDDCEDPSAKRLATNSHPCRPNRAEVRNQQDVPDNIDNRQEALRYHDASNTSGRNKNIGAPIRDVVDRDRKAEDLKVDRRTSEGLPENKHQQFMCPSSNHRSNANTKEGHHHTGGASRFSERGGSWLEFVEAGPHDVIGEKG